LEHHIDPDGVIITGFFFSAPLLIDIVHFPAPAETGSRVGVKGLLEDDGRGGGLALGLQIGSAPLRNGCIGRVPFDLREVKGLPVAKIAEILAEKNLLIRPCEVAGQQKNNHQKGSATGHTAPLLFSLQLLMRCSMDRRNRFHQRRLMETCRIAGAAPGRQPSR
jgi:hypothetical protein